MHATAIFTGIRKRNGIEESFNPAKIAHALTKAGTASGEFGEDVARMLALKVVNLAQQMIIDHNPTVEEVQDIVEEVLLSSPYKKTAKAYIIYRDQHSKMREIASSFNVDVVDQYLAKTDWQVKENSNMSFSLQGLNNYISSEISKIYWLNKIYPAPIKEAHASGDFHIHDLGLLSVYCVGWDLHDLLMEGFKGAKGKVESKAPRHFRTALGQIVNFFYTLQGEAAGAQAFSNLDTLMAPFIRYDNLSYEEVKQILRGFLFNINVPTRVGFQTPFTNVTLDLVVPSHFADQNVIVGGELKKETYKEFQHEMDMFNSALLEAMIMGDAKGRVFTFPIPTYNITKDFDWDNPNYKILWEMTARYGIPYFANFIGDELKPEDVRSMCCRLRIDNRKLEQRGGGLFASAPLTGSIGVVTINLPRIDYLSKTEKEFFDRLDKNMDLAKQSLEIKRKCLEKLTDDNLYPYTKYYLRNIVAKTKQYWANHFSTIGLVGMNEACLNFFGEHIGSEKGRAFAVKTLDFMRERIQQFQEETGNLYNLEATPAESTSYRLAQLDKKRYPRIISANDDAALMNLHPFYTNSTHLPVNYTDNMFEALDLQNEIQTKYTGGTVFHAYIGEKIDDPQMVKKLIKTIFTKYRLPYLTISPTFSVCPQCGYIAGEFTSCPTCSSECEVYTRIVGYLRPVNQWNNGKREEYMMRKTYKLDSPSVA